MSKGFWSRLNRWLFGPPLTIAALQSHQPARPPAQQLRTRSAALDEQELTLLFPWLTASELSRLLLYTASILTKYPAWTREDIPHDPWQQMLLWAMPLVFSQPDSMSIKEICALLSVEIASGLRTYNTPAAVLRQPVRILQGRRIETLYRLLEQRPGSHQHAMIFVWWVIFGM